jgi:hypothetical protein
MKNHANFGPEVKKCAAKKKPDSPECGRIFYRPHNTTPAKWKLMTNCPECRKNRSSKFVDRKVLGHYEVKNKIIDLFLRRPAK